MADNAFKIQLPGGAPTPQAPPLVWLYLSDTVRRDYRERGVFPDLYESRGNDVTQERAAEVLADARAVFHGPARRPGLKTAYRALMRDTMGTLRRIAESGTKSEAEARGAQMAQAYIDALHGVGGAALPVGTDCLFFGSEEQEYGDPVRIVSAYGIHSVTDEGGPLAGADGVRFGYKPGYLVVDDSGKRYFVLAGQLTLNDCKPAHIRLIATADRRAGAEA